MFEVTGTTVITPRPRRAAVALAASLLTTTAGRILLASDPSVGARFTVTISPRRIFKCPGRLWRQCPRPVLPHCPRTRMRPRRRHVGRLPEAARLPCAPRPNETLYPGTARRHRGTRRHLLAG